MAKCIVYNKGYKYQLKAAYTFQTALQPERSIGNDYVTLSATGKLTVERAYAWDGASGAPDVKAAMRASLAHDALYQLMREGYLDETDFRQEADELFYSLCVEDGLAKVTAKAAYLAIRALGSGFADPANDRPPTFAPTGCAA